MNVRLITASRDFVTTVEILPFNTLPEIVVWGERFFSLDPETVEDDVPEYVEAFAFFVPVTA